MRRTAASVVVIGFFSLMLVGTSKPKEDASDATTATPSAKASASATPPPAMATIPPSTGWAEQKVAKAKVKLRVPPGATVSAATAGTDPSQGSYLTVHMPSGYDVYVSQGKVGAVAKTKAFYARNAAGEISTIVDAPDALVANRKEGPPIGAYCETTACSAPVRGKPLCVESVGALDDGKKVTKLTADECLQVVAIVRSIADSP